MKKTLTKQQTLRLGRIQDRLVVALDKASAEMEALVGPRVERIEHLRQNRGFSDTTIKFRKNFPALWVNPEPPK